MNQQLTVEYQLERISAQLSKIDAKRVLISVPESAGDIFLATSLLESLVDAYPNFEIYFACKPEYRDILKNNPYITKIIDYYPIMDSQLHMEGTGEWRGLFDISIMATILTQRFLGYLNNGIGKIMFDVRG